MFRLADGRELLYQWDLDRQVIVNDPSIVEVHFCNRTDECSLVTKVIEGKADVPNILLQSSFDLRVFGYDGKATLHEKTFKVKARTQPADYVYEETEVLQWGSISRRMDELEEEIPNIVHEVAQGAVQEAINASSITVDAVTIDVSAIDKSGTGRAELTVTEDMKNFVYNALAGKDVMATLKSSYSVFPAAIDYSGSVVEVKGTAIYTFGDNLGSNRYYYHLILALNKDTGEVTATGYRYDIKPTATEEYVAKAIDDIPLDTVTIDISSSKKGSSTVLSKTEDLTNFIQSVIAGKDVIAFLKSSTGNGDEFFSTTIEHREVSTQHQIWITGTPYYTAGDLSDTDDKYQYLVQIIYDKETGNYTAYANKNSIDTFATEAYVDNAIANIEVSGGNVDLSGYYTKEEVDNLFNGIATAEGGSY